jgi:hyaluronoglucosaminidase
VVRRCARADQRGLIVRRPHRIRPGARAAAVLAVVTAVAAGCSSPARHGAAGADSPFGDLATREDPLPVVTPTPQSVGWLGNDVPVDGTVIVRASAGVDAATTDVIVDVFLAAGADDVVVADPSDGAGPDDGVVVDVGLVGDEPAAATFDAAGLDVPADLPPEGYALAAVEAPGGGTVALAGADATGAFYAAQTLRQLVQDGAVAGVGIVDRPAMAHRGAIEGFYGPPWTTDERLDQLVFYGRFKLNTYVYAPKDDPYHRDDWRDLYPPDGLADLARLVETSQDNKVTFTFALAPGLSICYSDPDDLAALTAKLDSLYAIGVRSFALALDDIDISKWNCPADGDRFGEPSDGAAAEAQVELVNAVQEQFIADREDARPLQVVPTEYEGTRDSDYRRVMRDHLDPAVEVMWTGSTVVPPEITVAHATAAAARFGRSLYLWDNTPVIDYPAAEGRLILAPYARREAGLSGQLTGIVLNPMNQAAASKVQLIGAADFAWNDADYDPDRAHQAAADDLAGGDPATAEALLAFFDLENLAPTSVGSDPFSQPQAPALAAAVDEFRARWADSDREGALAGLRATADRLAEAPALIRDNVVDPGFVSDCGPWLDATELWGRALVATLDGLEARVAGDPDEAEAQMAAADDLVAQAQAVETLPDETVLQGPVRVADGVLDTFLDDARSLS